MKEQIDPYDYLGHPVPLLEGEFSKQESDVSKSDLFVGLRHNASLALSLSIQLLHFNQACVKYTSSATLLRFLRIV